MRRVIVLGGLGQFGRTAFEQLRARDIATHVASRTAGADLTIDANDPASLRAALRAGDLILDAAGPFHLRNTALLEVAIDIGCDLIDINDDLAYAEQVLQRRDRIERANIRVLSSSSTVSAVAAAMLSASRIEQPVRMTALLVPASRHAAKGAMRSLARAVGQPVRVLRDGRLHSCIGWSESRKLALPPPVGPRRGWLFESADALWLPLVWPTLRDIAMYVDTNLPAGNLSLRLAARSALARRLLQSQVGLATRLARRIGTSVSGVGYEIADEAGHTARLAVVSANNGFITAVAPAVLAAHAITTDRFTPRGLILPDRHVEPGELFDHLESLGIALRDFT